MQDSWSINQTLMYDAMRRAVDGVEPAFILAGIRSGKTHAAAAATRDVPSLVVIAPTAQQARSNGYAGQRTLFHGAEKFTNLPFVAGLVEQHDPVFVLEEALYCTTYHSVVLTLLQHTRKLIVCSTRATIDPGPHWQYRFATWDCNPRVRYDDPVLVQDFHTDPTRFNLAYGLTDSHNPLATAHYKELLYDRR